MNYRHPNRTRTGLKPNRNEFERQKLVETYKVPEIKIGRFVEFSQSPQFSEYYSSIEANEDNEYGLRKGWFSVVDAPLFVEYVDLTEGLKCMLTERSRPRSFGREIVKATNIISKTIRDVTRERNWETQGLNEQRELALQQAIENEDHIEEFSKYEFLTRTTSEWEVRAHMLHPQPRPTPSPNEGALITYGYPIANSREDMSVRSQLAEIVSSQGIPVPDRLLKLEMNVVPVVDLHCELSAMKTHSPVFGEVPREITLGPIEIHKF